MNDLQDRFTYQLDEERAKFKKDWEAFDSKKMLKVHDFDTIMCAMEQTNIDMTNDIRQEFQSIRDELKNRTQERVLYIE